MAEKQEVVQLDYYIGLIIKKRWFLIIPFCLSMLVGIYFAFTTPPVYEASTLILVEPQRVPGEYVRPIVGTDIESRISTLSQQIQSRSNLEKIIADFKLFSGPNQQSLYMEDKLEGLRKRIKIDVTRARQGADAFTISFRDGDPQKTMRIANALAAYFIDANLKLREEQASGTSAFLEAELDSMKGRLEDLEGQLGEFRNKNMGELPEQLDSNLRLMGTLEGQLSDRQQRLRDERSRLMILMSEIGQIQRDAESVRQVPTTEGGLQRQSQGAMTLPQLREQLAGMQGSYTDRHPDVVRLKKMIEDLEAKEALNRDKAESSPGLSSSDTPANVSSPVLRERIRQRMQAESAIAGLQTEIDRINQQIREYRLRIERTPQREEQLSVLRRDYQNLQASYSSLLNRKLEADMAVNLEKKNKGEQFRILDFAKLPEKPISPDLVRLLLIFTAAGLGLGAGLIFVLNFFNNSFRRPEEIEEDFSIRLLAIIPRIYNPRDKLFARVNLAMTAVGLVVAVALLAGFSFLALNGVQSTLDVLQTYIVA